MKFLPSPQQQDFFNWIQNGSGSCVLEAVAGSGKTTTLIEALKLMEGRIFFGAYNKKIAVEIQERAPKKDGLFISTMHAAGFGVWRKVARFVQVDGNKCRDIFRQASSVHIEYQPFESVVLSLVSLAKQAGIGFLKNMDDYSAWCDLVEHFNLDCLDNDKLVIQLARKTLEKSQEKDMAVVDFDDMIYAPLFHKAKFFTYDWVLIDEAQDTNATRRALALAMLKRGGRLVAVGDKHQAIYGFTGADADSLELIRKSVSAQYMPLTVTYRCPQEVVKYAQQWVSHIHAHESAPAGTVQNLSAEQRLTETARVGDAILCRFNAPLISYVYQFIASGIPAKIEGREIGNDLKTLARRWKVKSFDALIKKLDTHLERETTKYRAKEQESRAVAVEDKINCLKVIINRVIIFGDGTSKKPVDCICAEIDAIFGDDVNGGKAVVVLSTIHKSKGREWENVFWIQAGPSKWARMEWELEQEKNLCYVAATRAKSNLYLVEMEKK